jgi:hypothetical protein
MTLDEAVTMFERELPDWWWSVAKCRISCHGNCGPDAAPGYRDRADYGISPIDVEINHPTAPAELILALMAEAKKAIAEHGAAE